MIIPTTYMQLYTYRQMIQEHEKAIMITKLEKLSRNFMFEGIE